MSDPYVRRDEETRSTTVEHVKLLRNRLEATTKQHLSDLQSYLIQATEDLSRQVDHAAAVVTGRAQGKSQGDSQGDESESVVFEGTFNTKIRDLDRKLIARMAKLEERMGSMIDARLRAFAQKLDGMLGKMAE